MTSCRSYISRMPAARNCTALSLANCSLLHTVANHQLLRMRVYSWRMCDSSRCRQAWFI